MQPPNLSHPTSHSVPAIQPYNQPQPSVTHQLPYKASRTSTIPLVTAPAIQLYKKPFSQAPAISYYVRKPSYPQFLQLQSDSHTTTHQQPQSSSQSSLFIPVIPSQPSRQYPPLTAIQSITVYPYHQSESASKTSHTSTTPAAIKQQSHPLTTTEPPITRHKASRHPAIIHPPLTRHPRFSRAAIMTPATSFPVYPILDAFPSPIHPDTLNSVPLPINPLSPLLPFLPLPSPSFPSLPVAPLHPALRLASPRSSPLAASRLSP